jgi:hypothetical protein
MSVTSTGGRHPLRLAGFGPDSADSSINDAPSETRWRETLWGRRQSISGGLWVRGGWRGKCWGRGTPARGVNLPIIVPTDCRLLI